MDDYAQAVEDEARLRLVLTQMLLSAVEMERQGRPDLARRMREAAEQGLEDLDRPPDATPILVVVFLFVCIFAGVELLRWFFP